MFLPLLLQFMDLYRKTVKHIQLTMGKNRLCILKMVEMKIYLMLIPVPLLDYPLENHKFLALSMRFDGVLLFFFFILFGCR